MVSGKGRRGETDRERATSPLLSTFSLQVFLKFSYSRKVLRSPFLKISRKVLRSFLSLLACVACAKQAYTGMKSLVRKGTSGIDIARKREGGKQE